jgi:hypothetical protein
MCGCILRDGHHPASCDCRCHKKRSADPRFGLSPRPATKEETVAAIAEAFIAHQESNSFQYLPPSLRDQFAMAAMPVVMQDAKTSEFVIKEPHRAGEFVAVSCYAIADAMLKQREVKS